jgi:hypothetical protein
MSDLPDIAGRRLDWYSGYVNDIPSLTPAPPPKDANRLLADLATAIHDIRDAEERYARARTELESLLDAMGISEQHIVVEAI